MPVTIEGKLPVIAFNPKYLADAFEIGATLRLVDGLNPGMATDPSGNFCLVMNMRITEEAMVEDAVSKTQAPASATAA